MNKISTRLTIAFGLFAFLLIATFVANNSVLQDQEADGLIINLAGRQRMLTQKMTKELLTYASIEDKGKQLSQRDTLNHTVQIFNTTLTALHSGGAAPVTLAADSKMQNCPASAGEIKISLEEVQNLWGPFQKNLKTFVASEGADKEALAFVLGNNVKLLKAANKSVELMQGEAEAKVSNLYIYLILAVILGIVLFGVTMVLVRKTITDPLSRLTNAADLMSKGTIENEIEIGGAAEITSLSQSFERLRISMVTMLEENEAQIEPEFDALEGL